MCFSAKANTPQPPFAFYDTLLSIQADSANQRGLNQCCPIVSVLLMWAQSTELPASRWVQEKSIFLMRGQSILILSYMMTFSTSFMSSNYFLPSLTNLYTISISSSSGNFSAPFLAILMILVQALRVSTLCSLYYSLHANYTMRVKTGRGIMLVLFLTYFKMWLKSSLCPAMGVWFYMAFYRLVIA